MARVVVLGEADVRRLLDDPDRLTGPLTEALVALSAGRVSVPARIAAAAPGGLLAAMPGHVPELGLAAKLVSVYPGNPERGRPSHQALVVVVDEDSGTPVALLAATHLTAVRTAVTTALAARALARPGPVRLAVLGAGVQGRAHLAAFARLLPVAEIRVASRRHPHAVALAARYPTARALGTFAAAVDGADVVCCCTDARDPVLGDGWVRPGMHLSSVGTGAELPAATVARATVFVESRATALAPPPAGAVELQGHDPRALTELGEVLAGTAAGRLSASEVTVYKSTGHAAEDVAAAAAVLRLAGEVGLGTAVHLD